MSVDGSYELSLSDKRRVAARAVWPLGWLSLWVSKSCFLVDFSDHEWVCLSVTFVNPIFIIE